MVRESDSRKSEQILEAAARLMRQKSFKDLSMDELAAEAGVAKGTLYLYFRSKGDIYLSMLLKGVNTLSHLINQVTDTATGSAREKLETIFDLSLQLWGNQPSSGSIPLLAVPGTTPEEIEDELKVQLFPKVDSLKRTLADIFSQGTRSGEFRKLDPLRLAGVFLHLLEYCYVQGVLLADQPADPSGEMPFIKDLFFRGILV